MYIVPKDKTRLNSTKSGLVAEASEIGLAPGEWPELIVVVDDGGVGYLFYKGINDVHSGEVRGVRYGANGGHGLLVIND